MSFCCRTF